MKSHHWRQISLHPAIPKPLTPPSPITQFSKTQTHHKIQMKSNSPKMVRQTHYWLLKTEPSEWSWEDQSSNNNLSKWDGVKNKQAQNNLKSMKIGDLCFFYHSGTRFRRIVGVVTVVREWYSDGEGSEGAVDVRAVGEMRRAVDLKEMKEEVGLKGFGLFRQPRLSVVPVPEEVWKKVCEMGGGYDGDGGGDGGDDDNE